jgi:agmatine deiminase
LKKWRPTITDATQTCQEIGIEQRPFDLVVDGGNIVRFKWKAIMTERVLRENKKFRRAAIQAMLMDLLNVDELILIPEEPGDPYGHADGCIRFIDNDTVLINEPHQSHPAFVLALRKTLKAHRLGYVEMPCFIDYDPKYKDSAVGNYVNYLQVGDIIVAPSYAGYDEYNHRALEILRRVFAKKKVFQVEATSVAKEGGVLNCISWESTKG